MWFRVELNKDGSVAKCEHVDAQAKDGRHVRYIEAETSAKACKEALRWYAQVVANDRERRRADREQLKREGRCIHCRQPSPAGTTSCKGCQERKTARRQVRELERAPTPLRFTRFEDLTQPQRTERAMATKRRIVEQTAEKIQRRKDAGWGTEQYYRLRFLQEFQAEARARTIGDLLDWLTTEIRELEALREGARKAS